MKMYLKKNTSSVYLIAAFAAVVVAYSCSLNGPFVFDDFNTFVHNEKMHVSDLSVASIIQALNSSKTGLTSRPIALFTLLINYHYFGLNPFSYKLVNLLIHLFNGFLLYSVLHLFLSLYQYTQLQKKIAIDKLALTITAIWLLHPLNLTSVLYVVQRMASLSCTFMFMSLLAYLAIRKQQTTSNRLGIGCLVLMMLSLIAGFFTKENSVVVIGVIFAMETIVFQQNAQQKTTKSILKWCTGLGWLCLFVLVASIVWNWQWFERSYETRSFNLEERLLTQTRVLWFYVKLILMPNINEMNLFHDDYAVSKSFYEPISTLSAILAGCVVVAGAWLVRKNAPLIWLGVCWFLIGHVVESSIISLELVHEHRNYFPMIGIWLSILGIVLLVYQRFPDVKKYTWVIYVFIVLLFTGTFIRAQHWRDMPSLVQSEVIKNPNSIRDRTSAALWYTLLLNQEENPTEKSAAYIEAKQHLEAACKIDQNSILGLLYLIKLNENIKKKPESIWLEELEKRLKLIKIDSENMLKLDAFVKCNIAKECKTELAVMNRIVLALNENKLFIPLYRSYFDFQIGEYLLSNNLIEPAVFYFKKAINGDYDDQARMINVANILNDLEYHDDAVKIISSVDFYKLNSAEQKQYFTIKNQIESN